MAEKLTIEAHHPLVFVPFHKNRPRFAASPLIMNCSSFRNKHYFPATLAKTHTKIQVFTVQEVTLVQGADIQHRITPNQHAGAGNSFNLNGAIR